MPEAYPQLVREVAIIQTVIRYPSLPTPVMSYVALNQPSPPASLPNLGILGVGVSPSANKTPNPSPTFTPFIEPTPVTPDLLGQTSLAVEVRKSP